MEINKNILHIIEQAQQGNQIAFSNLMDLYWNGVYNFMLKRVSDPVDTEDITIETFSKAFDKIKYYDNKYSFNTWLVSIAKNVHIDILRKRKLAVFVNIEDCNNKDFSSQTPDLSPTIEELLIERQDIEALFKAIKLLRADYKKMIQLRYFEDYSYQQISEILNESVSNIKIKLFRAKKLLLENIKNKID
ncbi:MAG: RNA polymerase sigma factor [Bacteroidota bacterium]|nr:RNA polymerase sigma factor [Bacteroidota bacterium]